MCGHLLRSGSAHTNNSHLAVVYIMRLELFKLTEAFGLFTVMARRVTTFSEGNGYSVLFVFETQTLSKTKQGSFNKTARINLQQNHVLK